MDSTTYMNEICNRFDLYLTAVHAYVQDVMERDNSLSRADLLSCIEGQEIILGDLRRKMKDYTLLAENVSQARQCLLEHLRENSNVLSPSQED